MASPKPLSDFWQDVIKSVSHQKYKGSGYLNDVAPQQIRSSDIKKVCLDIYVRGHESKAKPFS